MLGGERGWGLAAGSEGRVKVELGIRRAAHDQTDDRPVRRGSR
ncbi:hypothetical protein ACH34W_33485 [Actinomadura sp. 6N118]